MNGIGSIEKKIEKNGENIIVNICVNGEFMLESLMQKMRERVENIESISPEEWLDYASKLNVLRAEEDNKLWELGQRIAQQKTAWIMDNKMSVAAAQTTIEGLNEYKEFRQLKAKLERVSEEIRLAKIRAKGALNEFGGY